MKKAGLLFDWAATRAFERAIAEIKPHRSRVGDLLSFVEIARRAFPVSDRATKRNAGEKATRNLVVSLLDTQALYCLFEPGGCNLRVDARHFGEKVFCQALQRKGEMGATER